MQGDLGSSSASDVHVINLPYGSAGRVCGSSRNLRGFPCMEQSEEDKAD